MCKSNWKISNHDSWPGKFILISSLWLVSTINDYLIRGVFKQLAGFYEPLHVPPYVNRLIWNWNLNKLEITASNSERKHWTERIQNILKHFWQTFNVYMFYLKWRLYKKFSWTFARLLRNTALNRKLLWIKKFVVLFLVHLYRSHVYL